MCLWICSVFTVQAALYNIWSWKEKERRRLVKAAKSSITRMESSWLREGKKPLSKCCSSPGRWITEAVPKIAKGWGAVQETTALSRKRMVFPICSQLRASIITLEKNQELIFQNLVPKHSLHSHLPLGRCLKPIWPDPLFMPHYSP